MIKRCGLLLLSPVVVYASSVIAEAGLNSISSPGSVTWSAPGSDANASVSYGYAYAYASGNCGGMDSCGAGAVANFEDSLTIRGASGILEVTVSFNVWEFDAIAAGGFQVGANQMDFNIDRPRLSAIYEVPFGEGVPVPLWGYVYVNAGDFDPQNPYWGAADGAASVWFSSFRVLDTNLQPITGFRYLSDSFTDYHIEGGVFVPEPVTEAQLFGGLSLILLVKLSQHIFPRSIFRAAGNPLLHWQKDALRTADPIDSY